MTDAEALELEIMEKAQQLAALRQQQALAPVDDYEFQTLTGRAKLSDFFANRERLLVIHNMGQGCRYCTLWADGINGFIDHLEDAMAVVVVSKDAPQLQRRFALSRGWRFTMASHGGGAYMKEQCAMGDDSNYPGAAVYELVDGKIMRRGRTVFGPGDLYAPIWHFLSLAGMDAGSWTPQFKYWSRPMALDDGGENVRD